MQSTLSNFEEFVGMNFDPKQYLNSILSSSSSSSSALSQPIDPTTLLSNLQLHSQGLANKLSKLHESIISDLPKLQTDIAVIQRDANLVEGLVENVKKVVADMEQDKIAGQEKQLDSFNVQTNRNAKDIQRRQSTTDAVSSNLSTSQSPPRPQQTLSQIMKMDTVKSRLEDTLNTITEHMKWNTLESDVKLSLEKKDFSGSVKLLVEAMKSLNLVSSVSQHEQDDAETNLGLDLDEKKTLLQNLTNQFESIATPALIESLSSKPVDSKKWFVWFNELNRLDSFWKYFVKSRKIGIMDAWKSVFQSLQKPGASPTVHSSDSFGAQILAPTLQSVWTNFIQAFYLFFNKELNFASHIFDDPQSIVVLLCRGIVMNELKPSMEELFAMYYPVDGGSGVKVAEKYDERWLIIVSMIRETEKLIKELESLVGFDGSLADILNDSSNNDIILTDRPHHFLKTPALITHTSLSFLISQPFSEFILRHAEYEYQFLESSFVTMIRPKSKPSPVKSASTATSLAKAYDASVTLKLSDIPISKLAKLTEQSLARCWIVTKGFGILNLIDSINKYFDFVSAELTFVLNEMEKQEIRAVRKSLSKLQSKQAQAPRAEVGYDSMSQFDYDMAFDTSSLFDGEGNEINEGLKSLSAAVSLIESLSDLKSEIRKYTSESWLAKLIALKGRRRDQKKATIKSDSSDEFEYSSTFDDPDSSITALSYVYRLNEEHIPKLRLFMESVSSSNFISFSPSLTSLTSLAQSSLLLTFQTFLSPLCPLFRLYCTLPIWKSSPQKSKSPIPGFANTIQLPQFRLDPSKIVTNIGEILLNWPTKLERWIDDLERFEEVQFEDIQSVQQHPKASSSSSFRQLFPFANADSENPLLLSMLSSAASLPPIINPSSITTQSDTESTSVTHYYLTTLCHLSSLLYLQTIIYTLPPSLSQMGRKQISVDIEYFRNVLTSLDVELCGELEILRLALNDESDGESKNSELTEKVKGVLEGYTLGDEKGHNESFVRYFKSLFDSVGVNGSIKLNEIILNWWNAIVKDVVTGPAASQTPQLFNVESLITAKEWIGMYINIIERISVSK
ncbi:Golgi complex component 7-domain-containing protein [Paraphysoderma sedebokerense]|nr:Golgi complex component 7-domain-containing protein [Paraphysoderma sedebokerense]